MLKSNGLVCWAIRLMRSLGNWRGERHYNIGLQSSRLSLENRIAYQPAEGNLLHPGESEQENKAATRYIGWKPGRAMTGLSPNTNDGQCKLTSGHLKKNPDSATPVKGEYAKHRDSERTGMRRYNSVVGKCKMKTNLR